MAFEMREPFPYDEFLSIVPHPDWSDGRKVFLWERFDAIIDPQKYIRAEITWDDDCDNSDKVSNVYDPKLRIEANEPREGIGGHIKWETLSDIYVDLTCEEALSLVKNDPKEILSKYRDKVDSLILWSKNEA